MMTSAKYFNFLFKDFKSGMRRVQDDDDIKMIFTHSFLISLCMQNVRVAAMGVLINFSLSSGLAFHSGFIANIHVHVHMHPCFELTN